MYPSGPCQVQDYSVALGTAAVVACPANSYRSFLMMQYNGTASAVVSFTNNAPVAGSPGCYVLSTAQPPLIFPWPVPNSPVYVGTGAGELSITQG